MAGARRRGRRVAPLRRRACGGADDARGRTGGGRADSGRYEAERLARAAPYGVGYHVASWRRSEAPESVPDA
ncbi:hypothetical protein [Actinomadura sp. J1-007]|uniref:hypothetical protein n=1 Tax=Actinomadura sp. J1-007 TaxID=2661913 RepID=UPI001F4FD4B5|nr:hypothetical protein [Actinomadura sp. J1-007]